MIHSAMSEAAAANPTHCAVWSTEGSLSYAQLDDQSTSLAHWINQHFAGTGHHIALLMPKSIDAIIAIFGILKSGNTYAPLGENWTKSRLQKIFDSSGFTLCITHLPKEVYLDFNSPSEFKYMETGGENWKQALATPANTKNSVTNIEPTDLAYVLYTSGSTGIPKGVCVSHRAASHFPSWAISEFKLGADDRVASVSPLTFDLTTFDIFATLGAGATLYLVPDNLKVFPARLSKFLVEQGISRIYAVPSTLILLTQRGKLKDRNFSKLKSVIFAGEEFPVHQFQQLTNLLPNHIGYSNLYGPTETNVCTYFHVPADFNEARMPLGHALPGMHLFVRNKPATTLSTDQKLEGELCVSGPSVMSGYLGQKDSNPNVWVETPQVNEVRAYATGDQASYSSDELWQYHGRIDKMVKIWGYRVELGEIETCLLSHEEVEQAVVVKRASAGAVGDELIGFVVRVNNKKITPSTEEDTLNSELITHCKTNLPQYMVPRSVRTVSDLPLNNSGKVDRLQLEKLASEAR